MLSSANKMNASTNVCIDAGVTLLLALYCCSFGWTPSALAQVSDEPDPSVETPRLLAQAKGNSPIESLSAPARQLGEQLKLLDLIVELKERKEEHARTADSGTLLESIGLRQKISMIVQHASIEIEEAVAAIDGDLSLTNMLLAYVSSRRDRALLLNNVATFVGSGTFGLLDSSSGIRLGPPAPNVLGIIGNSIATGFPLASLRERKYETPRSVKPQPNTLAPIFGRPYAGEAYDPVIWNYLESTPSGAADNMTRRQQLLRRWQLYRNIGTTGGARSQADIDMIVGIPKKGGKVTFDLLKTRAELLYDLRSVVQQMYRDISELNSAIMALN